MVSGWHRKSVTPAEVARRIKHPAAARTRSVAAGAHVPTLSTLHAGGDFLCQLCDYTRPVKSTDAERLTLLGGCASPTTDASAGRMARTAPTGQPACLVGGSR